MAGSSAKETSKRFLIEDETQIATALDEMGDGIWSWNLETEEVYYSDRWLASLGYDRSEIVPTIKFVDSITHPDDRDALDRAGSAHLEGRTDYFEAEYRLRTRSGEWRWTRGRGRVLERTPEGQPVLILGVNYDISESKLAQAALVDSERHLRTIVETAGCVIICLDTDLRITDWNAAAERIYGWSANEVIGKYYPEWFLPESVRDAVLDEIARVLAGGEAFEFENPVIARDGTERSLLWNSVRMVDANGKASGLIAIAQDITDRNLAERQRQIAYHEAQVLAERINALRGLLPMCSGCMKIRDAEGQWATFDDYLVHNADVEVSHGLCPACLATARTRGPA